MSMMDVQLNSWLLFDHAVKHHGDVEVVTRFPGGNVHRYRYRDFTARAQRLMHALDRLGIGRGERVATLAWNHYRHLEAYFAIPCTARVLHTLNLRLSPAELAYIIQDAEDRVILVDPDLVPLVEQVRAEGGLRTVEHVITLDDQYESLIGSEPAVYDPIEIEEHTPFGLCYTSGTTGKSKGVLYTHRSSYLHVMGVSSACGPAVGPGDSVLAVVPMFHAMAWGLPHTAAAAGAKQVFLAGPLEPEGLVDMLVEEKVTIAAGVPTVWIAAADELAKRAQKLPDLTRVMVGGSQPPRPLIERYLREFGVAILQAWGMTETSPLASIAWPRHAFRELPEDEVTTRARTQAGLPIIGCDVCIRDEAGNDLPFDGKTMGDLYIRGPWVAASYYKGAGAEQFVDGWFKTGDVAIGSPDGYFVIADRTKDLIKSGGEWISSVDMEGAIMGVPGVKECAVVAMPDEKWQERPLACVVVEPGAEVTLDAVRAHLERNGWAKWQLPDRIELIDEVPRTSVGKFDKKVLRARFAEVPAGTA